MGTENCAADSTNTGNLTNLDKIKERVQKLLNQAEDRAGTREGETFYQKAFELMARYGFEERDLDNPDDDDEVIRRVFTFSGSYTDMQANLLFQLTSALHCVAFGQGVYSSTRVRSVDVFGVRRHVERVAMLYGMLSPQMAAGARGVSGTPEMGISTVVARRSYMQGFAATIFERLCRAESDVATGNDRYALALVDDQSKAEAARAEFAMREGLVITPSRSKRSLDGGSYFRGVNDGKGSDLGQTRVRARPALPC